jgi:hypothetical protein
MSSIPELISMYPDLRLSNRYDTCDGFYTYSDALFTVFLKSANAIEVIKKVIQACETRPHLVKYVYHFNDDLSAIYYYNDCTAIRKPRISANCHLLVRPTFCKQYKHDDIVIALSHENRTIHNKFEIIFPVNEIDRTYTIIMTQPALDDRNRIELHSTLNMLVNQIYYSESTTFTYILTDKTENERDIEAKKNVYPITPPLYRFILKAKRKLKQTIKAKRLTIIHEFITTYNLCPIVYNYL